jgi:RimJ/RimL family protein N-acetyltransferase
VIIDLVPDSRPPEISLALAGEGDIPFLSALAKDPAVAPFLAVGAGDADALRALLSEAARTQGPHGPFVVRALDGEPLGGLALRVVNQRSRICQLSRLMIRPDRRGVGIGLAAVRRACRLVLAECSFHRLELEAYGDNLAGQALFARAGFTREGTRRRAYWRRGKWLDGVQFGMLAEELDRFDG